MAHQKQQKIKKKPSCR